MSETPPEYGSSGAGQEPPTEEELTQIGRVAGSEVVAQVPIHRLVNEIRRLRRLIASAGDSLLPSDAHCVDCDRTLIAEGASHAPDCPLGALEAEARRLMRG